MPPSSGPTPLNTMPPRGSGQMTPPPKKTETGSIFAIALILLLLILGAFYLWGARLNHDASSAAGASYIPSGTTTLPDVTQ